MQEFRFNQGLLSIGTRALVYSVIKTVYLPSSLKSINYDSLQFIPYLKEFVVEGESAALSVFNKCLYNKDMTALYSIPSGYEGKIIFPSNLIIIKKASFCYSNVVELNIPESVTNIETRTFWHCLSLNKILLPSKSIYNEKIFEDIPNLREINIGFQTIPELKFYDSHNNNTIPIERVIIRNTTKNIADNAFKNITHLKTITIPNSVVSIGVDSFNGLINLRRIIIHGNPSISSTSFSNTNPSCVICDPSLYDILIMNGIHKVSFFNCFKPQTCENLYFSRYLSIYTFVFIIMIL